MHGAFDVEHNTPEDLPKSLQKYVSRIVENDWLEHPLFRQMFPFTVDGNIIDEIEKQKRNLSEVMQRKSWDDALSMIKTDKYCAKLVNRLIEPKMEKSKSEDECYWKLVFECVRNKACTFRQQPDIGRLLKKDRSMRSEILCGEEFDKFQSLEFPLVAWRGVVAATIDEAKIMVSSGLSWSRSRDVALKFSKRSHYSIGTSYLAMATFHRNNIIACLPSYNEEEVLVDIGTNFEWSVSSL